MSTTTSTEKDTKAAVPGKAGQVVLPPDATILMEARIKAGEPKLQLAAISNLILHDPVLTLDLLQVANSIDYGGAPITDLEGALTRLGTKRLLEVFGELNFKPQFDDPEALEIMEVLRYNCRRTSIVSLIVATVTRPTLVKLARMSGLFVDVGHMVALALHGKKYVEIVKANKRKMQAFRLQKDLNCDIAAQQIRQLTLKGVPKLLILPYDPKADAKSGTEADLRWVMQAAFECTDAFDSGKFDTFKPDKELPARSALRMLKITPVQHERLYKTCAEYLKMSAEKEASEGASMLVSSDEVENASGESKSTEANGISVPLYSNNSVQAKSREALQDFFTLCEQEKDPEVLCRKATSYLRERGLFAGSALIKLSANGDKAQIDSAQGVSKKTGDSISLDDPLSPIRAFRAGNKSADVATKKANPLFGSSAYALGPVEALPSGEKLLLYVDLGAQPILSLESRRVFRLSLGLLSQSLKVLRSNQKA